jgi:pimeloyl-ACP methyl ester carboxylesterase
MKKCQNWLFGLVATAALAMVGGCATRTPVGVVSLGRDYAYNQIDESALNAEQCSSHTTAVLHRYALERTFAKTPADCIAKLHALARADNRRDPLFALSELSFLVGREGRTITVGGRTLRPENWFAASAVYAYLYLLQPGGEAPPDAFDRRFRVACDLYNRSLSYILARREGRTQATETEWALPVGSIRVQRSSSGSDFDIPLKENETFVSADRFRIHGLSVRNRNAGLGAPIIVMRDIERGGGGGVSKAAAATAFLRVQGGLDDFETGKLRGTTEVLSPNARNYVEVDGRRIPLETDLTTPIAYALNDPFLWKIQKTLFRLGQSPFDPGIYPVQPYQPGKVPVLFVHGTMSSPVWWAEMWNTLVNDPTLRGKCQFWFYLYDSAKPVGQSAAHLRDAIDATVRKMDPDGKDPMLRQMVVIGHSQGGLLTKLTATRTGDALIRATTGKTLAELALSPDEEKIVRRMAVLEPLPEVKRVVFISTPHRGSYLAGGFARTLARRFLDLPQHALQTTKELLTLAPRIGPEVKLAATSIDTMAPDNPAVLALAEIPVAPPIKAHSIIAVKGDDVPPEGGDGVVKYRSAHIDGVESEFVVRSAHSCQSNPLTIEEVRRILLLHLAGVVSAPPSGNSDAGSHALSAAHPEVSPHPVPPRSRGRANPPGEPPTP